MRVFHWLCATGANGARTRFEGLIATIKALAVSFPMFSNCLIMCELTHWVFLIKYTQLHWKPGKSFWEKDFYLGELFIWKSFQQTELIKFFYKGTVLLDGTTKRILTERMNTGKVPFQQKRRLFSRKGDFSGRKDDFLGLVYAEKMPNPASHLFGPKLPFGVFLNTCILKR